MDGQPENIMPSPTLSGGEGIKMKMKPIKTFTVGFSEIV